jgi:hypothetical protein
MNEKSLEKLIKGLVKRKYPMLDIQEVFVVMEDLGDNMMDTRVYLLTNHTVLPDNLNYKEIKNWVKEMGSFMGEKINLVSFANYNN